MFSIWFVLKKQAFDKKLNKTLSNKKVLKKKRFRDIFTHICV
jgi:hypothetical protein